MTICYVSNLLRLHTSEMTICYVSNLLCLPIWLCSYLYSSGTHFFGKCLLFQKALASYIKKYAYSNAKTEDLWAVLEEESGEPVKDLMTTWTKQQGYPVIYAKNQWT